VSEEVLNLLLAEAEALEAEVEVIEAAFCFAFAPEVLPAGTLSEFSIHASHLSASFLTGDDSLFQGVEHGRNHKYQFICDWLSLTPLHLSIQLLLLRTFYASPEYDRRYQKISLLDLIKHGC
jgi:hypothetical protein